jgi:hypothetical protein
MNPSPWAALLVPKTPEPTTTHGDQENPPEDQPASPGPIPGPITINREDMVIGWRDQGGEFTSFTPF